MSGEPPVRPEPFVDSGEAVNAGPPIRMAVNGRVLELNRSRETDRLLPFLRSELDLTGTREGCAEGDCGACMVLVARREGATVGHRPVNACITPLGALDGQAVTTVEGLGGEGGALHPVQQAMVEHHASQCGFCTPGFVVSVVALGLRAHDTGEEELRHGLAGNLCRCTGYRPILDAARAALAETPWPVGEDEGALLANLEARASDDPVNHRPRTLDQLFRALDARPGATLVAGGTDLVPAWVAERADPPPVVWIGQVEELCRLETTPDHLDLGGAVSLARAGRLLVEAYPELEELVRRVASPSITLVGTLGGNLANASPVGDYIPTLIALGARVKLTRRDGDRWLPLEDLFTAYRTTVLAPGEVIETVRVPRRCPGQQVAAYKVGKRFDQDTATVLGAFSLRLEGTRILEARVSFGGMSAVPGRAAVTEEALEAGAWDMDTVERALEALAADFEPISDVRGPAHYRAAVAGNLLRKFFLASTGREPVGLAAVAPVEGAR